MSKRAGYTIGLFGFLVGVALHAENTSASPKCLVQFVPVEADVKLEVLDWGGKGRPVVFLAALGADAHEFDEFAPKFAGTHHVYGITRRGFGGSSKPENGYSNDRLGQDVVAVIDALHLERPVLVGHSMAGMELSWVGTHHRESISGLIYLEAAYGYAYYSETSSDPINVILDALDFREKLRQLPPGGGRPDQKRLTTDLLADIARLERGLRDHAEMLKDSQDPVIDPANPPRPPAWLKGIYQGLQKYTRLDVPVLAIFAVPHALGDCGDPDVLSKDPAAAAAVEAEDVKRAGSQADALERGVQSARVVRIAHAPHFLLQTNEQDLLREMNAFLAKLP
jgi:pimeloyl-ACP methyl ester carboxylesterase